MDLTVQGGQSSASYMESAADWPPHTTRVPRKPKVAQFCAAPWPNFPPALTIASISNARVSGSTTLSRDHFVDFWAGKANVNTLATPFTHLGYETMFRPEKPFQLSIP